MEAIDLKSTFRRWERNTRFLKLWGLSSQHWLNKEQWRNNSCIPKVISQPSNVSFQKMNWMSQT